MADTRTICKTCLMPVSRVFNSREGTDEDLEYLGYQHIERRADHPAIPIPANEAPFIDQVCDFCGEPNIAWIFPTDPNNERELAGITFKGEDGWAACLLCHDEILACDSGPDLAQRLAPRSLPLRQVPPSHRKSVLRLMGQQYQHFLDARTGQPITYAEYVS